MSEQSRHPCQQHLFSQHLLPWMELELEMELATVPFSLLLLLQWYSREGRDWGDVALVSVVFLGQRLC